MNIHLMLAFFAYVCIYANPCNAHMCLLYIMIAVKNKTLIYFMTVAI